MELLPSAESDSGAWRTPSRNKLRERSIPRSKERTMAKVKLNPAFEAIHGHVGDLVFKRWGEREIVGKMPDRTGIVPTANQLAQQDKFRLAALYGKAVLADPITRQVYEDAAQRKGVPVFALTVGDFLNEPAIDEIDLSDYTGKVGEPIRVRASD